MKVLFPESKSAYARDILVLMNKNSSESERGNALNDIQILEKEIKSLGSELTFIVTTVQEAKSIRCAPPMLQGDIENKTCKLSDEKSDETLAEHNMRVFKEYGFEVVLDDSVPENVIYMHGTVVKKIA